MRKTFLTIFYQWKYICVIIDNHGICNPFNCLACCQPLTYLSNLFVVQLIPYLFICRSSTTFWKHEVVSITEHKMTILLHNQIRTLYRKNLAVGRNAEGPEKLFKNPFFWFSINFTAAKLTSVHFLTFKKLGFTRFSQDLMQLESFPWKRLL